jgi:hypothetical protein
MVLHPSTPIETKNKPQTGALTIYTAMNLGVPSLVMTGGSNLCGNHRVQLCEALIEGGIDEEGVAHCRGLTVSFGEEHRRPLPRTMFKLFEDVVYCPSVIVYEMAVSWGR